eukprot:scaffold11756_cov151-Skeletonema_menzelii.AAC.14
MSSRYRIRDAKVSVGCPLPSSSGSGEEWKSFQFHFHDFANLTTTKKLFIASPEFSCNGHQWQLHIYSGGNHAAEGEGNVSAFLHHLSEEAITTSYEVKLIDKFGEPKEAIFRSTKTEFAANKSRGWPDFISRSFILDESQNILDDNGTLTFVVSIEEEPTTAFVPQNSFVKVMGGMFNDQNNADVCFEVSSAGEKNGKKKKSKSFVPFYGHRFILEKCAPMLAAICGSNNDSGGKVIASVNDVKPDIFHHLLFYVYGGSIPEEELKTHAKGIIDAADKYSIVNLKLEAEAAYVQSADISLDNAMDNLLYADSRNCALLKEAVMNFLAENHYAAAARISFSDFPTHVVKDLLIAVGRNSKKDAGGTEVDELTTLSVSSLRRKLDKMGLEVDGSREAMIESFKSHS